MKADWVNIFPIGASDINESMYEWTYLTKYGDSWFSIASEMYGNLLYFGILKEFLGCERIEAGFIINIPVMV